MLFIDTSILLYAHDETEIQKSQVARRLLVDCISSKKGCISTQVIHEFCNVVLKKSVLPLKTADVREIVREILMPLLAHIPDNLFYLRVLETYKRYSLSFYDSAIVQAAMDLNCSAIYSEDMQNGALYGKARVINPFLTYEEPTISDTVI